MKTNKGFTLIELLVVIAIIGILSSVVLASLNTARSKGSDAAIKASVNNMRSQAALWYDGSGNGTYSGASCAAGMFSSTASDGLKVLVDGATNAGGTPSCFASSTAYRVYAPLKTSGFYCIDSTGLATTTTATPASGEPVTCR